MAEGRKLRQNSNMKSMYRKLNKFNLFMLVLISLGTAGNSLAQTVKIEMEPNHSTIGFVVKIARGVTRVTGKFTDFALQMDYVDQDITKSSVVFTIQAESIDTGIDQRDRHLRSADFFDVAKFPEITFRSTAIRKVGEAYEVEGDFSMHGITRHVVIPFELTKAGRTPSARIRWSLNREDYGIKYEHSVEKHFLSKDIGIEIDFWTRRSKNQNN